MGEVHINNEDLIDFIEMAEQFKIRGVTKENSVSLLKDEFCIFIFGSESMTFEFMFNLFQLKESSISNIRRNDGTLDKHRKHKKIRLDDLNEGTTTSDGGLIETKSEIEFGDQSCQTPQATNTYGSSSVDYGKSHQRMAFDDPGPSSVQPHNEQWLDDKHFLNQQTPPNANSNATPNTSPSNDNEQQRCKTKSYKALEPCSCPLCARVYSNVSNLRQHMRLIHNPTSVICPLCQKSFTSDLYLKRHYLSMHGSAVPAQTNAQPNNPNSSQQLQNTQPPSQQQQPQQTQTQQQVHIFFKN